MRILVVNVFFAPQSIGGATRVVEDNVNDFQASDRVKAVGVFCSLNGAPSQNISRHYLIEGVPVHAIATRLVENADFLLNDKTNRDRFGEFLDYFHPDLIHFHCLQRLTSDIVIEAATRGLPYLITMHDGWWISNRQFLIDESGQIQTYNYENPVSTLQSMGEKAVKRMKTLEPALKGANRLLTVSETFKTVIESSGLKKIEVIQNGVSPIEVLEKPGADKVTLGYLAGAAYYKGYHLMRAAISGGRFSNLRLIMVDHSLLQGQIITEHWGETEVERIGFIPQEQIAKLYQRIHAVLVPSIWPESFGLVAREAMLSRAWLIASNRGAAAEDIQDGINGHVFDPSVQGDLKRVLTLLNEQPQKYIEPIPEVALKTSAEQSKELLDLYETILS